MWPRWRMMVTSPSTESGKCHARTLDTIIYVDISRYPELVEMCCYSIPSFEASLRVLSQWQTVSRNSAVCSVLSELYWGHTFRDQSLLALWAQIKCTVVH